jgi:DNA-binding CsgD family transcriptional regulator
MVYSGHSRQEVADILGMSCESVDMHLAHSRVALDARLAPSSGSAPAPAVSI